MTQNIRKTAKPPVRLFRRLALSLLSALLLCALIPATTAPAAALDWMTPYLDRAVEWGILRDDLIDDPQPNEFVTRADFVAMVNRAYGYKDVGPIPFEDVDEEAWYYDDICIAYNIGYFLGHAPTIAYPERTLTREEAAVILARNMMIEPKTGEALGFADSRELDSWSRGLIEPLADTGVIGGYPDGTFQPKNNIKRIELAAMLVRAVGTPIQEEGTYADRNYSGNVTITSPNVKLKDAVITGDLYISGGIDLGGVELENVTVMGRIVVSGGGQSERGKRSVILRNVTAEELLVDNITNQFVTVQAEGLTSIPVANVRTHAYLEDLTEDGWGLQLINLDGEDGSTFQLAGNIKEAVNLTPSSTLNIAQGIAHTVTVDEKAVSSTLNIDGSAEVGNLNLDTATNVTGTGDVSHLEVNAPGCQVEMLPDTITIRPGITANINGEEMDTQTAVESSEDPRLLAGYPIAKNVAPTSADAVFSTNKRGTVYWAISAVTSGSVSEEDLIEPPSYGGNILKSGVVDVPASNSPQTVKVTGLTKAGSYYLTAMLVDNRGYRSPVKVYAFSTPDDTVPAFIDASTYTILVDGENNEQILQAMVMANKNCVMYYALLPQNSVAPTPADFRANAVTGNLGFGTVELQKNTPFLVSRVNKVRLQEETTYDLYLWLTDADGARSSAVKKITVTTKDRTPPVLQQLMVTKQDASSVTMSFAMNEPGTIYWSLVKRGASFFTDANQTELDADVNALNPKIQIETGLNSLKNGKQATSQNTSGTEFRITGLDPQSAYDVYFVIKDNAGNYGLYTISSSTGGILANGFPMPISVSTLDNQAPTVTQEFTNPPNTDPANPNPFPNTSIRLVFSEHVKGVAQKNDGTLSSDVFLDLYRQTVANPSLKGQWGLTVEKYFTLYIQGDTDPAPSRQYGADGLPDDTKPWVVDYRNVIVTEDSSGSGKLIVTFPYNADDPNQNALNLSGGVTYYFTLRDIADTSTAANRLAYNNSYYLELPHFTTISAQIYLERTFPAIPADHDGNGDTPTTNNPQEGDQWYFDYTFSATPLSHQSMGDDADWDLMVWSDTSITFRVYESTDNGATWDELPGEGRIRTSNKVMLGASIGALRAPQPYDRNADQYGQLKSMQPRLYAIDILSLGEEGALRENWNVPLTLRFTAVSGVEGALDDASNNLKNSSLYDTVIGGSTGVIDVTSPAMFTLTHTFTDDTPPEFSYGRPEFAPGDSSVSITLSIDRLNSTYYYLLAPVDTFDTYLEDGTAVTAANWETTLPETGVGGYVKATQPSDELVTGYPDSPSAYVRTGRGVYAGSSTPFTVDGLKPLTKYVAYFVLQGVSQDSFSPVYCFRFETGDVATPIITLDDASPEVGYTTSEKSQMDWLLLSTSQLAQVRTFTQSFYSLIGPNDNNGNKTQADLQAAFSNAANFTRYFGSMNLTNINGDKDAAGKDIIDYNDVRVIDALMANYDGRNSMSVFDYYADASSIYSQVLTAIQQGSGTAYYTDKGTLPTEKGIYDTVPPEGMVYPTQYYFIAAARNEVGSKYGFAAISGIHVTSGEPPKVTSVITHIDKAYDAAGTEISQTDFMKNPGLCTYDGSVTIVFDKTPYRTYTDSQNNVHTVALDGGLKSLISSPYVQTARRTGDEITITFKGVHGGWTLISLFNDGTISDQYGVTSGEKLELILQEPQLPVDPTYPQFDVDDSWKPSGSQ